MSRPYAAVALGVIVTLFLAAVLVAAQPVSVIAGRSFQVLATHDGLLTTSYTLNIGGAGTYTATLPVSALSGGVITFTVPGLTTLGQYSVTVAAVGPGGTAVSDPLGFTLVAAPVNPPAKPAAVRIVQ